MDEDADPTKSALSAVAALAAAWPQLHQGCSLKSLDLDSCTLSEILRLHILASGADVTSANAKYRYQKRGGFDATDDACMELRLSNPSLVKKLSSTSVYDLTPGKLQVGIFFNLLTSYPFLLSRKLTSQQETPCREINSLEKLRKSHALLLLESFG